MLTNANKVRFVTLYTQAALRAQPAANKGGWSFLEEDREALIDIIGTHTTSYEKRILAQAVAASELKGTAPSIRTLENCVLRHYSRIETWTKQARKGKFRRNLPTGEYIGMAKPAAKLPPTQRQFDEIAKKLMTMGITDLHDVVPRLQQGFKNAVIDQRAEPKARQLAAEFKANGFTRDEVERVMLLVEEEL